MPNDPQGFTPGDAEVYILQSPKVPVLNLALNPTDGKLFDRDNILSRDPVAHPHMLDIDGITSGRW
jgi:hypothetical protein